MKRTVLKTILALVLVVFIAVATSFDAAAEGLNKLIISYEIEGAGVGAQGTYLVKVTIVKKKAIDVELPLKLAAVHGVLFRGFTGERQVQKPIAGSAAAEAEHLEFYTDFFDETGSAKNYASVISGSTTTAKVGKNYQITATLSVQKEALRKYLEDQGVIKSLNSAF